MTIVYVIVGLVVFATVVLASSIRILGGLPTPPVSTPG